jgi:hypothetical protein
MSDNEKDQFISIGKAKVLAGRGDIFYVKKCVECGKKLTPDEASYGHDCE